MHFIFLQGGVYIGKLYCKTSNKTLRDSNDGCTRRDHLGWHNRNRIASIFAQGCQVTVSEAEVAVACNFAGGFHSSLCQCK